MRTKQHRYCTNKTAARYAEKNTSSATRNCTNKKSKKFKAFSFVIAFSVAAVALIIPTTTLAPNVDAFEDSKAASYSVGNVNTFSSIILDNCAQETTVATTEQTTTAVKETKSEVKKTKAKVKDSKDSETKAETVPETTQEKKETETENTSSQSESETEGTFASENDDTYLVSNSNYLLDISNPDSSYSPKKVVLSDYDRAKTERLVMGEAGTMGYVGAALVAQTIRDSMNRSNTTSIDRIISQYSYDGSTANQPNEAVKQAVAFIFDQNGSAVQHRLLCFYTGVSSWHETQEFIVGFGNVRFFDFW